MESSDIFRADWKTNRLNIREPYPFNNCGFAKNAAVMGGVMHICDFCNIGCVFVLKQVPIRFEVLNPIFFASFSWFLKFISINSRSRMRQTELSVSFLRISSVCSSIVLCTAILMFGRCLWHQWFLVQENWCLYMEESSPMSSI